jgi:uncharacterized protein DUF4255
MAGVEAIQGVDDTLRDVAKAAVASLVPRPKITVGGLDLDDDELRLNWFLYRVSPNLAYRNMEPPRTGWHTARGRPPLALRLSYLLTAHPAKTAGEDQEQFAHAGLAAVMRALHEDAVLGEGDPPVSPLARPLVEPLRITMDDLDIEAITKLWTAATSPIRLSVGYEVSLVVVDVTQAHVAGPPVQTRRVAVVPSLGPRLAAVSPARASAGVDITLTGDGLTTGVAFTLPRAPDDPAGTGEWPMTVAARAPGQVTLRLPDDRLVPGLRPLQATATEEGLPAGRDAIGVTIVPAVAPPAGPLARGATATLQTAHAAPDVEAFLAGAPVAAVFVTPTQVQVTVPDTAAPGAAELVLRAGKVSGPPTPVVISP